jgi:hypothetical protein
VLTRATIRLLAAIAALAGSAATGQNQPPPAATAQSQPAAAKPGAPAFKPEEIEALVAPIALYPDALLSQVLMASTYPLEVVQAARWVKANPNVKGDAAVKAVEDQKWDVSVKSLVAFPQILEPMSEKVDWTQKLGDAFLGDQKAVMGAVQRLRQRAQQSGNLKSSEQQKVVVEEAAPQQTVIKIEPANPQVVYVPAYNPTVVYGAWAYPAYPPYYWAPPAYYYPAGGALASGLAFGVGVATVGAIFGGCDWGRNEVNVNVNRATNIDRNFNRNTSVSGSGSWQHDASHRGGVAYRDSASRERYSKQVPGAETRQQYRGHEGAAADRAAAGRTAGDRAASGAAGDRATGQRAQASAEAGAFEGVGSGGAAAQRDFDRGQASSSHAMANRSGGSSAGASSGAARAPSGAAGGGFSGGGARAGGGGGAARGGGGRR